MRFDGLHLGFSDEPEQIEKVDSHYNLSLSGESPMPIYRHLGVWKHGNAILVRFGDHQILDENTVIQIAEELYGVADREDCHHLILDFSSVLGISTLMLGKLLMLRKKISAKQGRLILCDISPQVQDVLTATKLTEVLDFMDSEADALRALAE